MPSARSIFVATVASASAQYTTSIQYTTPALYTTSAAYPTSVSVSGYDQSMPTLSSYGSPQYWQQWDTYSGGWSSSATYATSASPVYSSSAVSTYLPVPVSTSAYGTSPASSSAPYENPFTIYLSQTNSMGVITGMPSVVTSQPVVVTSQPAVATTPAGYVPTSAAVNTTLITSARPTSSSASSSGFNQIPSSTTSALVGNSTGAAAKDSVTGAGLALVIAGMVFSLL